LERISFSEGAPFWCDDWISGSAFDVAVHSYGERFFVEIRGASLVARSRVVVVGTYFVMYLFPPDGRCLRSRIANVKAMIGRRWGSRTYWLIGLAISGWRRLVVHLEFYDRVVYTDFDGRIFLAIS